MLNVVSSAVTREGVVHPETPGSGDARPDAGAGYSGVSTSKFIQLNIYHVSIVYISVLYFFFLCVCCTF